MYIYMYMYVYIYIYAQSAAFCLEAPLNTSLFIWLSGDPHSPESGTCERIPLLLQCVYIYVCTNNVYNRIYIYIHDIMFLLYTFDTVIKNNRCTILSTCSLRCPKRPGPRTASSDRSTAIFIKGWMRWAQGSCEVGSKIAGSSNWVKWMVFIWYLYGIYMVFIWY